MSTLTMNRWLPLGMATCAMLATPVPALAVAGCPPTSPSVNFASPGVLEATLVPGTRWTGQPGVLPADIAGGPTDTNVTAIPDKSKAGLFPQLDWMTLRGRIAPISGSLATDFRLTWRYGDVIEVRVNGKVVPLARQDLEKYPDLLARFQTARPLFDHLLVSFLAVERLPGGTREEWVRVKIPRHSFVLPAEGKLGISSPSIPDRWSDRMSIVRDKHALGDVEASQAWRRYASVRCPSAVFVGLKLPEEELSRIAQALEDHKMSDEKRDKAYAPALDGLDTPVPAYARSDALAQPYDMPLVPAQEFSDSKGVGLKVNGRVVWQSRAYRWISKVDKQGRYFTVNEGSSDAPSRLIDGRGRVKSVKGHSEFGRVREQKDGSFLLDVYDARSTPFTLSQKDYTWVSDLSESEFRQWRSGDGDGRCRKSSGRANELSISTTSRYKLFKGVRITADSKLSPVRDEVMYFSSRHSHFESGRRVCEAP